MKNKGVRNSEAIDVQKIARHQPSGRMVACNDYSFYNNIVFFLTMRCTNYNKIEIKTGLKGILEKVPPRKNARKASQNVFLRSYHDFTRFEVI